MLSPMPNFSSAIRCQREPISICAPIFHWSTRLVAEGKIAQINSPQALPAEATAEREDIPVALVRHSHDPLGAQALVFCLLISDQEDLARRIKIDRSTIANLLRLLDLAEPVQVMVRERCLDMGHARALLSLEQAKQLQAAQQVERDRLGRLALLDDRPGRPVARTPVPVFAQVPRNPPVPHP